MSERDALLTLACTPGTGARTIRSLRARAGLDEVLAHPDQHADVLSSEARVSLRSGDAARRADAQRTLARARGIRILNLDESDYPYLLKQIYDPPPVLYVWGSLHAAHDSKSAAIVGSRRATARGLALARGIAADLARSGVEIVSGLARGIDAAAHRGALDACGRTVAVLGSGLDCLYPREHAALAEAITREGAVVTEYAFGTPPYPAHFPRRNRIIAGWTRAVVVVEAGTRSGALGTVRLALDEGRDVFAVPGWPGDASCEGTNQLIREGAALVRNAADVAAELDLSITPAPQERSGSDDDGLLRALRRDQPSSLEELQERSGWPVPAILTRLTELELGSRVRRLPGPLFLRS